MHCFVVLKLIYVVEDEQPFEKLLPMNLQDHYLLKNMADYGLLYERKMLIAQTYVLYNLFVKSIKAT